MEAMTLAGELVDQWLKEFKIWHRLSDAELGELTRRIADLLARQQIPAAATNQ